MKTETRFNEVFEKLNKKFKRATEEGKDSLVSELKSWCRSNKADETGKLDAIHCFLADNNIF